MVSMVANLNCLCVIPAKARVKEHKTGHSGARAQPANPEPMYTDRGIEGEALFSWVPGLPKGIPE